MQKKKTTAEKYLEIIFTGKTRNIHHSEFKQMQTSDKTTTGNSLLLEGAYKFKQYEIIKV